MDPKICKSGILPISWERNSPSNYRLNKFKSSSELIGCAMDEIDKIILSFYAKDEEIVQKESEYIIESMKRFSYFSDCNEDVLKEFCVYTSLATFEPGQMIIGSDKHSEDYTFFVLKGSCQVVVCLPVIVTKERGVKHYRLYKPETITHTTTAINGNTEKKKDNEDENTTENELEKYGTSESVSHENIKEGKCSPITINDRRKVKWKNDVDIVDIVSLPPNIKPYFMNACYFRELSCFSLGESFEGRYIVAKTKVEILKIPRHFLFKKNVGNVWNKLKQFLEQHVPNKEILFREFVNERRWRAHIKEIKNDLIANRKCCYSNRIENVPYHFRIKDNLL